MISEWLSAQHSFRLAKWQIKLLAETIKKKLDAAKIWSRPIVTEIVKAETFYKAEDYHQDYFALNGQQPYCRAVIVPKMDKFRKAFKDILKK